MQKKNNYWEKREIKKKYNETLKIVMINIKQMNQILALNSR